MDSNDIKIPPFESKLNNRFFVQFPESFDIQKWVIHSVARPKYDFQKGKWLDMELTLIDPIEPSTSERLEKLIEDFKGKSGKPLFTFYIQSLDPRNAVIEQWEIRVKKVLFIDFGHSRYGDDQVQKIHMLIRPCRCSLS
jgi:hypothetical protein